MKVNTNNLNNFILRFTRETMFAESHDIFIEKDDSSNHDRHSKKKTLAKKNADENTLNIPLREVEVLVPTPPEQHHHISMDVHHKVDILKWVMDNHDDPALTVCTSS